MRVVIDTNVIISAALSKNSTTFRAFERVLDVHQSLISSSAFEELEVTSYKPKFEKYFSLEDTRLSILATVLGHSTVIVPSMKVTICRDPKDNMFLELAVSGKADCIISSDPDLLVLHPFENIPIISPKDFLERF